MKQIILPEGVRELSYSEASEINGGESLWYWVGYGIGASTKAVGDFYHWLQENPQLASEVAITA